MYTKAYKHILLFRNAYIYLQFKQESLPKISS